MEMLLWPSVLFLVGLALVALEVFVPSGGALGFLSVASIVGAIVMAFAQGGAQEGIIFIAIAAVAVPTVLIVAFRVWPNTPMGRRILLDLPSSAEVLPNSPLKQQLRELIDKFGVAKSKMLPSGAIEIDGQTIDALSEGAPIERGQRVKVIDVRGTRVIVRAARDDEGETLPGKAEDVLAQPIDELGADPFATPSS